MAQADWSVSADGGSYGIVIDGTSPGTNTSVADVVGLLGFSNITVGAVMNARAELFMKPQSGGTGAGWGIQLHASDLPVDGGAGSHAYEFRVLNSGSNFNLSILKKLNGVPTTLASSTGFAPLTGLNTDWQKWRMSSFTTGGVAYLRFELWNGAAYIAVIDVVDSDATLATLAGYVKFFTRQSDGHTRFDDVKIYTLT